MRFGLVNAAKKDPRPASMQGPRRQRERLLRLEGSSGLSPPARGHGAGSCSLGLHPFERDLRQPAHGVRTSPQWAYHRPQRRRPADAREWAQSPAEAVV
jgi:hypothetical protein